MWTMKPAMVGALIWGRATARFSPSFEGVNMRVGIGAKGWLQPWLDKRGLRTSQIVASRVGLIDHRFADDWGGEWLRSHRLAANQASTNSLRQKSM